MVEETMSSEEARSLSQEFGDAAEMIDEVENLTERENVHIEEMERIRLADWLVDQPISSHFDIEKNHAIKYNMSLSDSRKHLINSVKKYGPELALDRVIRSNIMPSLEGLERNEIRSMYLHAKDILGPNSLVTETLDRMANSDSLSLF